jgi:hypothetical protein
LITVGRKDLPRGQFCLALRTGGRGDDEIGGITSE